MPSFGVLVLCGGLVVAASGFAWWAFFDHDKHKTSRFHRWFYYKSDEVDDALRTLNLTYNKTDKEETLFSFLIRNDRPLTDTELDAVDCVYRKYNKSNCRTTTTSSSRFVCEAGNILDYTTDVLVNPANSAGLGCFSWRHNCLDEQIHHRAGPRLREECRHELSKTLSIKEGDVLVTKAYHCPCVSKFIFHTVGPNFHHVDQSEMERRLKILESCYTNCLTEASNRMVESIAFPVISGGVYGLDPVKARQVGEKAIRSFLDASQTTMRVMLIWYDPDDPTKKIDNHLC